MILKPLMVEEMAAKYKFSWEYYSPADGEWGARQETGEMSGLIGLAGLESFPKC